jgi:hypothetical protein
VQLLAGLQAKVLHPDVIAPKGDHAILMATDKKLDASHPFVYAEAARHPSTTSEKKAFIPVWIPSGEVAAIFDFTEADSEKMGFK